MKQILFLLALPTLFACVKNKEKNNAVFIDLTSNIVDPKHYVVSKNHDLIFIDGIANEPSWDSASFSDLFIDIEGIKKPKYDTKFKLLWDDYYLYVFAHLEEPHVWGNLKLRDTVIFYNNDFEVFIDPSGTTKNYGEIEINALETVWDLLLDKPYREGGKPNNHWNLYELKWAVHIAGTLNDYSDIDSFWTVEMAIPMKALIELKNEPHTLPVEGEQWRINFSRVQWDFEIAKGNYRRKMQKGKYLPEYNWVWSNQKVINMHEPEKWGILQFTNKRTSTNIEFNPDPNMPIKQVAFALYRQTRRGELKKLEEEKVGTTLKLMVKYTENDTLEAQFSKTNFGFEYKIKNPGTKKFYIINETGTLIEKDEIPHNNLQCINSF